MEFRCVSFRLERKNPHLSSHIASFSPVAVDVQDDVRGADGDGHLVPLVVSQAVGEHLGVGLLASGAVVETHLAALATALQLQEPGEKERLLFPHPFLISRWSLKLNVFVLPPPTRLQNTSFVNHGAPVDCRVQQQRRLTIARMERCSPPCGRISILTGASSPQQRFSQRRHINGGSYPNASPLPLKTDLFKLK